MVVVDDFQLGTLFHAVMELGTAANDVWATGKSDQAQAIGSRGVQKQVKRDRLGREAS